MTKNKTVHDIGEEIRSGDLHRLPGRPKSPSSDSEENDKLREEWKQKVLQQIELQQIELVELALREQGLAVRQLAAMARTIYEDRGVRETIIGPQSMVTFGEGVFFILKEALEVTGMLRTRFGEYEKMVEGQIKELREELAVVSDDRQSGVEIVEERDKEIWMLTRTIQLVNDALKKKGARKPDISQLVTKARMEWDKKYEVR